MDFLKPSNQLEISKNARNTAQLKGGIEANFEFILIFKK
ncbi:hypothetical protein HPCPY1962_1560 [Helicobacter pylori CPY1962]|nr:hypothetical protein HPCPY1962_1560 [Helicobacter pylori CPY1962]